LTRVSDCCWDDEVLGRPVNVADGDSLCPIANLAAGMVLKEPITTLAGAVLLPTGEVLTMEQVARVQKLHAQGVLSTDTVGIDSPPAT